MILVLAQFGLTASTSLFGVTHPFCINVLKTKVTRIEKQIN